MTMTTTQGEAGTEASGKDAAWIAYVLHAIGYLTAMMWPALIGVIVNYLRRGDARGGYVSSHHAWMIRTFWYGLLWYLLSLGVILWSAWPVIQQALRAASTQGDFSFDWETILTVIGAAAAGGIGMLVTWCWLLYRVVRGIYHLSNSQPAP